MKYIKLGFIALSALLLGGCVAAPVYRRVEVPATPPPQIIYVREYPEYYYPYPAISWHIGFGVGRHYRR